MILLSPGWPQSHTVQSSTPRTPDTRFLLLEIIWYKAYWLMYGPVAAQYSPVLLKTQFLILWVLDTFQAAASSP
jgi:hypothetical protein